MRHSPRLVRSTALLFIFVAGLTSVTFFTRDNMKINVSNSLTTGIFEWRSITSVNPQGQDKLFLSLREKGFNTIFITLEDIVTLSEKKNPAERGKSYQDYVIQLRSYITKANTYDLKVYGLLGNPNWAAPDYSYINKLVTKFISNFNEAGSGRIDGLVIDHEFYLGKSYATNKQKAQQDYVNMLTTFREYDDNDLEFIFTIPFWANKLQFNSNKNMFTAITSGVGSLRHGSLLVMNYRNYLSGPDGANENMVSLFNELTSQPGPYPKLLIGQEITNVKPAKVTYWKDTNGLYVSINLMNKKFGNNGYLGGFSVNDLATFESMNG